MSTTVTYKGNTLATVSNNTKTLKTAGKYMEGDVTLTDTSSTIVVSETLDANGGIIKTITTTDEVNLQTKTITPTSSIQTVNPDTGYDGFSQVIVNAGGGSSDFIITVAYNTTTQQWEPDCTWAELSAANTAGKTIIVNATDSNYSYEPTADIIGFLGNDNHFEYKVNWFDFNQSLGLDGWVIHDVYHLNSSGLTLYQRDSFDSPKTLISKSITVNGTYNAITTDSVDGYSSVTVNVPTGSTINNQNKTVTPSESIQSITADSGYTGLGTVTVNGIPFDYVGSGIDQLDSSDLTVSGATVTVPAGYYENGASKSVSLMTLPTAAASSATSGYTSKATIGRSTAAQYINIPPGYNSAGAYYVISAVANGSATAPASISGTAASVSTGNGTLTLTKTVSVTPSVTAGYVNSGTAGNSSVSLTASVTIDPTPTASGATVTIPAGYYTDSTTKSVSSGSATGPTSLSSSSATITTGTNTITLTKTGVSTTPTVSVGYVSSATASTATVALTASVTVNPTPTTSGATVTIPAGYYSTQTTKSVTSGSATAPSSISGTAASVSTGTNTLTLTKTVSVTPTVSAGYVSSGTAGNSSVSLTASVTTKAAATITPTTTNQTIAAGTYLTGTQTIAGDADLVGSNILSTANIFGVQGTVDFIDVYIRSTAPTSSVGNDGDIYIQE